MERFQSIFGRLVGEFGIYGGDLASVVLLLGMMAGMRHPILYYNPKLKERARQLRRNMTPSERKLWTYLKGKQMLGYDFDRQRPIDQFIVDFYCKALKLAIEIDGSIHDTELAQKYDQERQIKLESLGIDFLRFRNQEVQAHIDQVLASIRKYINTKQSTP